MALLTITSYLLVLAKWRVESAEGLKFNFSWGLRFSCLSHAHARHKNIFLLVKEYLPNQWKTSYQNLATALGIVIFWPHDSAWRWMILVQLCCMLVTPFSCFVCAGSVADGGCNPFLLMLHVEQGCLLGFFALIVVVTTSGGFCC